MRNITVSVDDAVYRRARQVAAERDTSVSALVAAYLSKLGAQETEFERLAREEKEVLARIRREVPGFRAADGPTRDELYETARRFVRR